MRLRPLGWELTTVILGAGVMAFATLVGFEPLLTVMLLAWPLVTVLILISFAARLVVGIVDENRRYRSKRDRRPV